MFKNKPLPMLIASGLMTLLVIFTLVFQLTGGLGRVTLLNGRPGDRQGVIRELPEGFTPPSAGDSGFQPGSRTGNQDGFQTFQGQGFPANNTSMRLMMLLRFVQIGASVLIALLGILSIIGMLLTKNWGRVLAIISTIMVLLALIPSFFQRMMGLGVVETLIKFILAVVILVLCFLPRPRPTETPA